MGWRYTDGNPPKGGGGIFRWGMGTNRDSGLIAGYRRLLDVRSRDVVLIGTCTCTRVQLEYRFQVLVLVLVLECRVLVLVLVLVLDT